MEANADLNENMRFDPTHLQSHGNAVEAQAKAAQGRHRAHDLPNGPVWGEERRQASREKPSQDGVDHAEAERHGADYLDHANSRLHRQQERGEKVSVVICFIFPN